MYYELSLFKDIIDILNKEQINYKVNFITPTFITIILKTNEKVLKFLVQNHIDNFTLENNFEEIIISFSN